MKKEESAKECRRSESGPTPSSSIVSMWTVVFIAFIWMSTTVCMCGHSSSMSSIVILPAFCYVTYSFLFKRFRSVTERIFGAAAFGVITYMLVKNVLDIFWLSHGA